MLKYLVALISIFLAVWTVPEWLTFSIYGNVVNVQQVSNVRASAPVRMLTEDELSLYNGGENSKGLYLAILGQVFDVEKRSKHYGPGGGYHFFTGKDASRAFITGDLTEAGLTSDVSDFTDSQIVALWLSPLHGPCAAGKLTGQFYTESGQSTDALLHAEAFLTEGLKKKAQAQSEMHEASEGRVCGGIHRDWIGVPRMLFSPGSGHSGSGLSDPVHAENRNLRGYKDCPPHAESCRITKD
uniref:Neuferricin n=1 Tax=Sinocyclocheilus grahami TaxID=75366 RepID=A0A672LAD9_SINGR